MNKKFLSFLISATIISQVALPLTVNAAVFIDIADSASKNVNPLQYTYEIIPLLEPFNNYFFVKTDNPHPESFRFSDKDSPYSENAVISTQYLRDKQVYADVEYENKNMYRVNGGYIFGSDTTNGGEVTLQIQEEITKQEFYIATYGTATPENPAYASYSFSGEPIGRYETYLSPESPVFYYGGYYKWMDTDIKVTLPPLCDACDYLIQNYATESDFFSNMDAVQKGLSEICFYSGSYILGELFRSSDRDWHLATPRYSDQGLCIISPYDRKDDKYLFASSLYPFIYDSLGFPAMMEEVAKRLNKESSCHRSNKGHAYIDITYEEKTKSYGGAGKVEGQGLSEDKISHVFSFGDSDESLTLQEAKIILDDYAAVEMEDNIPREDSLTWEYIYNTVGDGAWVDLGGKYTYLYQKDDKLSFNTDESKLIPGYSLYWNGSLGYCTDMWVDGRYIDKFETFEPGETFDKHSNINILLTEAIVPELLDYEKIWDSETNSYIYTSAEVTTNKCKNVVYRYDPSSELWISEVNYYNSYTILSDLTKQGIIDEKYYDMLVLTQEEVEELINNNTNSIPTNGYIFDGFSPKGTAFLKGDISYDSTIDASDASLVLAEYAKVQTGGNPTFTESQKNIADVNKDNVVDSSDASKILAYYAMISTGKEPTWD